MRRREGREGGENRDQTGVEREEECKAGKTTRRPFVSILFPLANKRDKIHVVLLTIRKHNGRFVVVPHGGIPGRVFGLGSVRVFETGEGRDCGATTGECYTEKKKGRCACLIWGCVFGKSGVGDGRLFVRFLRAVGERGRERRWEIRVKRSDSLSSPVLFHQPEGRREQPPRAPVRHLGPARNNTCPQTIRCYGILSFEKFDNKMDG